MNSQALERIIREEFPNRHFTPGDLRFALMNRGHRSPTTRHNEICRRLDLMNMRGVLLVNLSRGYILADVARLSGDAEYPRVGGRAACGPATTPSPPGSSPRSQPCP